MKYLLKFIIILTLVFIELSILDRWYKIIILGRYWEHASVVASFFTVILIPMISLLIISWTIHLTLKSALGVPPSET